MYSESGRTRNCRLIFYDSYCKIKTIKDNDYARPMKRGIECIRQEFIAEFPELDTDDKLKKVPAPFPADFPEADFLKHKHYDVMSVKPEAWFESDDLLQKVDAVFRKMYKFNRFFNYTIDNQ